MICTSGGGGGAQSFDLSKIPESPGKNNAQRCFISKNGAQFLQKDT